MSRLDPFRNGLDFPKGEDADRIHQSNWDEQAKFNDKIGLGLLGSVTNDTAQTVSSTTFVDVVGLKLSVTGNGGLIVIQGTLIIQNNANNASYQLLVNGQVKTSGVWGTNANTMTNTLPLFWTGTVGAGQIVVTVQAKTDSTPITVKAAPTSALYILEWTKG